MANVLVVDDDSGIRSVVVKVLADAGYGVLQARDGAEALDQVRVAPPDCVLLDLHMPRMDGSSFLTAWRAERGYRKVPVVLFTSAADGVTVAAGLEVQACISKPFDLDIVPETISRVLGASLRAQPLALAERVDGMYSMRAEAAVRPAALATLSAQVAALRQRARSTRETIERNKRTMFWAENCLRRAVQRG